MGTIIDPKYKEITGKTEFTEAEYAKLRREHPEIEEKYAKERKIIEEELREIDDEKESERIGRIVQEMRQRKFKGIYGVPGTPEALHIADITKANAEISYALYKSQKELIQSTERLRESQEKLNRYTIALIALTVVLVVVGAVQLLRWLL
ncbi:hypothetical protein ES705_22078 [subsurface metagenome]|nr:hypothetical protein [Methanosarcinales archaeon]